MSAGSGFTPAAAPPCAYAPNMTLTAALALETAGALDPNCVVIVPGPVIGSTGNTGPTTIEIQPAAANDLGQSVLVHTIWDAEAWPGKYDAGSNKLWELTDGFDNVVRDTKGGTTTSVTNGWPWHLGDVTNCANNMAEDCTFNATFAPGVAQGGFLRNWCRNTVFNFTNKVGGIISNSEFRNTQVNVTGGGQLLINRSHFITSNIGATGPCIDITSTANVQLFDCNFMEGFSLQSTGSGAITLTAVTGELHGVAITLGDIIVAGTHALTMQANYIKAAIGASSFNLAGTGGSSSIIGSRFVDTTLVRPSTATSGAFNIVDSEFILCTLGSSAGATGATFSIPRSKLTQVNATLPAAQRFFATQSILVNVGVTFGAGATRGVVFTDCDAHSFGVVQNRTGGTNSDVFQDCRLSGLAGASNTVTLAGATNPAVDQVIARQSTITDGATLSVTDPSIVGGIPLLDGTEIRGLGTAVTIPAGAGRANSCRFAAGATVNLGTFTHTNTIVDGLFPTTFTAANANRLRDKAFSDVV